jgi:hypothetical protein
MRGLEGFVLIVALTVVLSLAVFSPPALGETNTTTDTGIEWLDPDLITGVWNASVDFAEEVTHEINISEDELGGQRSIDDLITLMQITLPFTSKVLELIQSEEPWTEPEMNVTLNGSGVIANEMVADAFQYLRFLQRDNLCEEAITMMDQGETWDY